MTKGVSLKKVNKCRTIQECRDGNYMSRNDCITHINGPACYRDDGRVPSRDFGVKIGVIADGRTAGHAPQDTATNQ